MTIRVLAFAGSPRRHGNSETLLDWVLDRMQQEQDTDVLKYALTEITIAPCKGCNACEKLNTCVQKDDLVWVEEKILEADIIILSAPIFCMGIAAQAKALIDRAQVFRSRKYVLKLPVVPAERKGKRIGIFLASAGQDWDFVFDAAVPSVKCLFNVIDVKNKDIRYLMVNNVDEKGAVNDHPTAQKDARALADEVIATMREMKGESQ
ncbi:MAG: flavodoxin family protein [Methanocalculus sp. MSAO_Arc1]|uniref:flavodoxin family protein n=1 Tax=Methanocalculus TaxID=71151 RepID=UPI000FF2F4F6|nr:MULTISPECIES: flavodoxin family protein [unclassified Methanocalculus]MCP1661494.1 NAD(P)H-dependent FMN reductase [Methanocalculus sp. AMF5]RQD79769.1 MAG: flavodoxin family protein [Methanocalculus sp. MSAO_Arc1]